MTENENLPDSKFRNVIAGMKWTISNFLQSEVEEYGMTFSIHNSLMAYKKPKAVRLQSMMTLGNFSLKESSTDISRKKILFCIPDGKSKMRSQIPPSFTEVIAPSEDEAIVAKEKG